MTRTRTAGCCGWWTGRPGPPRARTAARQSSPVIYLDDRLPTHPKLLACAQLLGDRGLPEAFYLFVVGIQYARNHMTDGFLPERFPQSFAELSRGVDIAEALCAPGVRLWTKVPGGYRIHHFHDWNPKASVIKDKREKDAARKRAARANGNGASAKRPRNVQHGRCTDGPRTLDPDPDPLQIPAGSTT